jgi:hypothetical protein
MRDELAEVDPTRDEGHEEDVPHISGGCGDVLLERHPLTADRRELFLEMIAELDAR